MKKSFLLLLFAALCMPWTGVQADELTVNDGTATNSYVPVYGLYADTQGCTSEFIIPADADGMSDLVNATISKLTFYLSTPASGSWSNAVFEVYMTEVDNTTLSAVVGPDACTVVYTGALDGTQSTMAIEFDENYTYQGGNLLVGTYVKTAGAYKNAEFYGISAPTGSGFEHHGSTNNSQSFLPKVTIEYTGGTPVSCPKPTGLAVSEITDNAAKLSWTEKGEASAWQICVNDDEDNLFDVTENPYTLTGLTALTAYTVKVRANCGSEQSDWTKPVSFNTTAIATVVGNAWSDNFEGALGWELINGELTNQWVLGEAANNGGSHALYISNDGGTTNAYGLNDAAMVYAVKLLQFEKGKYLFSYDWLANGESTWDYLRVALVPASVSLSAGTSAPSGFGSSALPSGWIACDGGSRLNGVTAWQSKEVAINVEAGNYYLVLAWRNDNGGGDQTPAAVDNVNIVKMACPYDVEGLAVNAESISTSEATVTWTENEDVSLWQVAYSLNSAFPDDATVMKDVDANEYSLDDLSPASTYYVRVRVSCSDSYGAWCNAISFTTECETVSAINENFDAVTAGNGVLPVCWSRINAATSSFYSSYPYVYADGYSTYSHSASNCLYFYTSGGSSYADQYAILPEMDKLEGKRISFYAKRYSSYDCTLKVGTVSDPADASTFTEIQAISLTADYVKYTVNLSGDDKYIALLVEKPSSSYSYNGAYVDDIVVEEIPSCLEPSELAFVSATTNSAVLDWTNGGDETSWDIYYSTENVAPTAETEPTLVGVTEKAIASGLNASSKYYVWVRAHCSDAEQSPWSEGISFTTECEAVTAFPWKENFEAEAAGNLSIVCWTNEHISGVGSYLFSIYTGLISGNSTHTLQLPDMQSNTLTKLVLPEMTLPGDNYQFVLDVCRNADSESYVEEGIRIYASADGEIEGATELAFISRNYTQSNAVIPAESTEGWYTYELPIGFSGKCYIIIRGESKYGAPTYMDNFIVEQIPTCPKPVAPVCDSRTVHSATLSWRNGAEGQTAWEIAYSKLANFNPAEQVPDSVVAANANPFVLNGLEHSTTYYACVRANCGDDGYSAWTDYVTFTTECEAIVVDADHNFFEGFEGADFAPLCWENIAAGTHEWKRNTDIPASIHSGNASAYSGYYGDIYLVMPEISLAANAQSIELTFWSYNAYVSFYGKNSVVLLNDGIETELWSAESVTEAWVADTINLFDYKGQTIKIAFKYEGDNAHGWYVDDVAIQFVAEEGGVVTGLENLDALGADVRKILRNGQIFILRGEKVYTIQGQETILP